MAIETGRTVDEILEQLDRLGPSFICTPGDVKQALDAIIAAIFSELESVVYTMHSRRFLCEADGDWLDEHGRERGVIRFEGEGDEPYRERVKSIEDMVTRPAILGHVDPLLNVGTARMEEWLEEGAFSDIQDVRGFSETSVAHSELRGFTIYIEEQLVARSDRAYALDEPENPFTSAAGLVYTFAGDDADLPGSDVAPKTAYADGTDPTEGAIYAQVWNEINRLRAGGLGPFPHFIVEIE